MANFNRLWATSVMTWSLCEEYVDIYSSACLHAQVFATCSSKCGILRYTRRDPILRHLHYIRSRAYKSQPSFILHQFFSLAPSRFPSLGIRPSSCALIWMAFKQRTSVFHAATRRYTCGLTSVFDKKRDVKKSPVANQSCVGNS